VDVIATTAVAVPTLPLDSVAIAVDAPSVTGTWVGGIVVDCPPLVSEVAVGATAVGGTAVAGTLVGGTAVGGTLVGGTAVGGTAVGGTLVAGAAVGGTLVAGTAVGGTLVGGTAVGGTAVGGTAVGGAAVGGTSVGFTATGVALFTEEPNKPPLPPRTTAPTTRIASTTPAMIMIRLLPFPADIG